MGGGELLIIGTSGQAKETAVIARQIDPTGSRWSQISYVTRDASEIGLRLPLGIVRYRDEDVVGIGDKADYAIGIGHCALRKQLSFWLRNAGVSRFPNLIHPKAVVDPSLNDFGVGNIIAAGVVITCDTHLGDFNLLNMACTIGHDCRIGDWNVVNPMASISGGVKIADCCLLGTGSRVIEKIRITSNVVIGAGGVVTRSIEESGTYVGIPARLVKK